MKSLLENITAFEDVLKKLRDGPRLSVQGLWESSKAALVAYLRQKLGLPVLVITAGQTEAENFFSDMKFFSEEKGYLFPSWETLPHEKISPHIEIIAERFTALGGLQNKSGQSWVVAPFQALIHKVVSPSSFKKMILSVAKSKEFSFDGLIQFLDQFGFKREAVVENKAEFSVRGGIIDVFSPQYDDPLRLEFDGAKIDSLRFFNPQTQISQSIIEHAEVFPACELELIEKNLHWGSFLNYFPKKFLLVWDHSQAIVQKYDVLKEDIPEGSEDYLDLEDLKSSSMLYLSDTAEENALPSLSLPVQRSVVWQGIERHQDSPLGYVAEIFSKIDEKMKEGYEIHLIAPKQAEIEHWTQMLKEKGIWNEEQHHSWVGHLSKGFILPKEKRAFLTEGDILGRLEVRSLPRRVRQGLPIQDYRELRPGDWVVHLNYGIGKFLGVDLLNDRGSHGEFLTIEYAQGAKLYVPVDQFELVERYIGIKGRAPKLNRLGGKDWEKTKQKAQLALMDFAAELLEVQAKRAALGGHAFGVDTEWQKTFEASFPFEETPDQWEAIQDVKKDLESGKPMDRLICGDVGFGKTEVAIRATFKVVMGGKQVAILVPTTVLAQQHYYTFRERFAGYPIEVEMLSRFRDESQQKKIIKKLKEGSLDVVIGTHRLFAKDICFKDLGLVVIDEEQRFGVLHKEKLKKMRASVDVLTLSATPIPRTLYLSLMQARDMSLIHTPPEDRLPIETILIPFDERVIRDAIVREISRDGQVFFIHNRVGSIHRMKEKLQKLVPQATFAVGHGQMDEEELSEVMKSFIEGKIQVLIATNIVESGLDIPNANTIIIDHADRFGLADLYQLRGRVGRFRRRAYAYLIYAPDRMLSPEAKMRLKTIEDFTDLGSGFKVAMRDLEIRGAGNILGKEQHGHIIAIGFQLYCRLLDENIRRLSGEKVIEKKPVSLQLGFEWGIPHSYLHDARLRMEVYHKIFQTDAPEDLKKVVDELTDRFGSLPEEMLLLIEIAHLKILARDKKITSIQKHKERIYFRKADFIEHMMECPSDLNPLRLVIRLRNVLKEKSAYGRLRHQHKSKAKFKV